MKETALANTWQDSEKAKIKEVTKNTLISWGVLKESEGGIYPTNAYALLTGRMPQQPTIQCGVFKGTNRAYFVDRREFEGPIQEQMEAAYRYVLEKINMGIPNYGYDWALPYEKDVTKAETIGNAQAVQIAVENNAEILFDEVGQTPYFRYTKDGVDHEVWFEDARSIKAKIELLYEYNLRGASFWQIMRLFRANWLLVDYNLKVDKL